MLSFQAFTILIIILILAPIVGVISLLMFFIFDKRITLLENEKQNIRLENELQTAKYIQLTEQINPHFLFNTLNVIISLARLDRKKELIKSLEYFSLFLKFKYQTTELLIPVREEIKYTNYYIEIQKLRFQNKLETNILIRDDLLNCLIPPFLLQTLVENSFKHALEMSMDKAFLEVKFIQEDNYIILYVTDNGEKSFQNITAEKKGVGLRNLNSRLSLSFPHDSSIVICPVTNGNGTTVRVKWPLKQSTYEEANRS